MHPVAPGFCLCFSAFFHAAGFSGVAACGAGGGAVSSGDNGVLKLSGAGTAISDFNIRTLDRQIHPRVCNAIGCPQRAFDRGCASGAVHTADIQ
jgi:hypothetical protein